MAEAIPVGAINLYTAAIDGVDISSLLLDFSVFHSIKKPYSSVVMNIVDNAGLLQRMKLDGSQSVTLSFGQAPDQEPYTGTFALTTLEKVAGTQNQRTDFLKATGYSPHMLNIKKVQRSFKDIKMTDGINDLVNSVLSPIKPFNIRAPSRNMAGDRRMPWTINGQSVFMAIRKLMQSSASAVDTSSAYVLFEKQKELVLDTLENMQTRMGQGPTYYQRQLGTDWLNDVALQQFTIMAAREDSRADVASQVTDQNQMTNVHDSFSNIFKQAMSGGGASAGATSYINLLYNSMRVPTYMQSVMSARAKISGQFDSQNLTITVPLNPALDVGEGFNAEMKAALGDTDDPVPDRISGALLCTTLRHDVNLTVKGNMGSIQGMTTVTGSKGSIGPNAG